jgi:hypothetical protein
MDVSQRTKLLTVVAKAILDVVTTKTASNFPDMLSFVLACPMLIPPASNNLCALISHCILYERFRSPRRKCLVSHLAYC